MEVGPGCGILLSVPLLVVHATLMRVLDATLMRVLDAILMRVLDATLMRVLKVTLMRVLDATLMRVLDVTLMMVLGLTWFFLLITLLISLYQNETQLRLEIKVFQVSKCKANKDYCNNQKVEHFVHCPKIQS